LLLLLLLLVHINSVASMINLGVITLLQHPDQLDALKKVRGVY
jgi:cytochrome P450